MNVITWANSYIYTRTKRNKCNKNIFSLMTKSCLFKDGPKKNCSDSNICYVPARQPNLHIHGCGLSNTNEVVNADEWFGTLQWRHSGCDSVSNHQPHDGLLNRLFRRRSKKTSELRVTGLCEGNSPGSGEFPAQMASNAENVSVGWRHHEALDLVNSEDRPKFCIWASNKSLVNNLSTLLSCQ